MEPNFKDWGNIMFIAVVLEEVVYEWICIRIDEIRYNFDNSHGETGLQNNLA